MNLSAAIMLGLTGSKSNSVFEDPFILNGDRSTTKKSISKSFRLDEDLLTRIDRQARDNNTSLNVEINNLLRKYVERDMLTSRVGMIPITKPILSEIFQKNKIIGIELARKSL